MKAQRNPELPDGAPEEAESEAEAATAAKSASSSQLTTDPEAARDDSVGQIVRPENS